MKYLEINSIIIKIFVFICSFIIIFMSPCARYFDTFHIDKIHAAGAPVVAEGAVIAWEWLMGLLASAGLGAVAYENREALASSYDEYLQAQIDTDMFIAHKVEDTCIQLYDKASDTVQNIPWNDYLNSINEFHDVAVDELTDVYVKVAPSLLGTFEDFITSIFAGETVVPGISDYIEEQYFTNSDVIEQIKGEYTAKCSVISFNYQCSVCKEISSCTFEGIHSLTGLSSVYVGSLNYLGKNSVQIFNDSFNGSFFNVQRFGCGHLFNSSNYVCYGNSWSANIPIFTDFNLAKEYVATGTGYYNALNYSRSIYDNITDNDDLPTIGRFGRELWERVANASDWGIGSYGDGVLVNDWATDLPFVGLEDLWNYALTAEDVYDKVIDDIINGVYDPTVDIPDTYDDAWHDVIDKGWDDVIDNPVNNPAKDPTIPVDPDKPVNPDKPLDPDIPIDDVIEIPVDSFIPAISDSIGDLNIDLKNKFPFCIPWDLYYLLTFLSNLSDDSGILIYSGNHGGGGHSSESVEKKNGAPVFRLPIVIERYKIEEYIIIDMSPFEPLSKISRLLFTLMFVYTLINWTVKIVSVRKDD